MIEPRMYVKKHFADLVVKYGSIFGKDKTMTDKQIIIDSVDVSGCPNFTFNKIEPNESICISEQSAMCINNKDCLYKKWQRKEQECEELKEKVKKYGEINEQETKDYAELKAKNEKLKKQYLILIQQLNIDAKQLDQLKAENKILKEKFEIAIKNNMDKTLLRLEKGDVQEELQEIREQFGIETLYCHVDNTRVHRCLDVLRLKDTLAEIKEIIEQGVKIHDDIIVSKQILQKISECEVEND